MKWNDDVVGEPAVSRGLVTLAIVTLLAAAFGTPAAYGQAADNPAGKAAVASDLRGEWVRNGPGFACKVAVGTRLPPEAVTPELLSLACLHLGPLGIGQDAKALKAALGEPHRTRAGANGSTQWVYFLEQRDHYPYLIATVAKERIVVLQVTGPTAPQGYGFNHIELGATTETLVSYFGQPNHVEPSDLKDTELWVYGVWPFSFEVKDGHVTSIRISQP